MRFHSINVANQRYGKAANSELLPSPEPSLQAVKKRDSISSLDLMKHFPVMILCRSWKGGIAQLVERLVRKDKRPIILTSSHLL